jgi:Putative metallopeptidase
METNPLNPLGRVTSRITMRWLRIAVVLAIAAAGVMVRGPESAAQPRQELAANSRVIIDYIDPRLQKSQATVDRLRKREVLEDLSMFLSPLRLPRLLRVRTKSCGQVNAFYVPAEWAINLCYEYYENLEAIAPQTVSPQGYTRDEVIVGGFIDAIFHELGHALFDMLNIPVFGREEDAADQLSAFLMLQFGKDVARVTIKGAAFTYLASKNPRTRTEFADEHGAPAQRFFNYMCLAYGGEPAAFQDYVDRGVLPKARAEQCPREYGLVRRAFAKTLLPHIDVEMMKKVQSIQWLRPTDGRVNK